MRRNAGTNAAAARSAAAFTLGEETVAKALGQFTIVRSAEGYQLHIEDDDGETLELTATFDQLDLIAEEIERQLDEDEDDDLLAHDDDEDEDRGEEE